MQNRSLAQPLHFRDFKILESRKHSGCCCFEVAQALILNRSPGFDGLLIMRQIWTYSALFFVKYNHYRLKRTRTRSQTDKFSL
ncbi:MAG TPA: hypothetical protein VKA34_07980 [Balneolales bacterium]|nr:hypothetical protein [Balneolales bacterium]